MRRMNAFTIFPKRILVAYFFGIVLILVSSSFVVVVGLSQASGVVYAATGGSLPSTVQLALAPSSSASSGLVNGSIITEQDSRTIYSSAVPKTIADGLDYLSNSTTLFYPMTAALATVLGEDSPIVVRGLPLSVMAQKIPSLSNASPGGNWTVLGEGAAKKLGVGVGSVLSLLGPNSPGRFNLTVDAVYSLGGEADYEALVPLTLGQEISGLQSGVVNSIVAASTTLDGGLNLRTLVKSNFILKLEYGGAPGTIDIFDSSGYLHKALSASGSGPLVERVFNITLPFGYYVVAYNSNGIRTTLSEFAPVRNDTTIESSLNLTTGSIEPLYVKNDTSRTPTLLNSENQTLLPKSYDKVSAYWLFQAEQGVYTLSFPDSAPVRIIVVGNTTYDPALSRMNSASSTLDVSISNGEAQQQQQGYSNSFLLTLKDEETGSIVFSSVVGTNGSLAMPLVGNHTFTASVLSSGTEILLEKNVTTSKPTESLNFTFPPIPFSLRSVPVSDYSSLGIGTPSGSRSENLVIGGVAGATIALFAIVFVLLGLAMVALSNQLVSSLRRELRALHFLLPSSSALRSRVMFPMLILELGAILAAFLLSFGVFTLLDLSYALTFLGYGLEQFPAYVVVLVLVVFTLISYLRIVKSMDLEVFG